LSTSECPTQNSKLVHWLSPLEVRYPDTPIESSPVVTLTLTAGGGKRIEMSFHLPEFAGHPGDTCMKADPIRLII